jgi:hypothetical protein
MRDLENHDALPVADESAVPQRLSAQEIFDATVRHLAAQGGPSLDERNDCRYRGPHGRRCAVGLFIRDEEYSTELEGLSPCNAAFAALPFIVNNRELLDKLQRAHDGSNYEGHNGSATWCDPWADTGIAQRLTTAAIYFELDATSVPEAFGGR